MKRTATLEDVARKAHVSKMTVSRVINHPELVAPELQVVVEDAMHKLNYHPNNADRALAKNQTSVVKFVILEDVDDTDPYFTNVLFGMAMELKIFPPAALEGEPADQGAADSYVITGARTDDYPQLNELKQPFVLFGENRGGYDFVDTNNLLGGAMATKYALKAGYRNVIFIGIDIREAFEFSREAGYVNTMQQNKKIPSVFRVENSLAAAREFIQDHLGEFPKNTCFACASDRIAMGVIQALVEAEAKIPEDFGVIGYDGVLLDRVSSPTITTVKQNLWLIGEKLASPG
ncbi:LacI family DNA-binding transcriptional regulator [Lactobacillus delbrueckii]|uniref:LacI family DNA-binding transcriptional regulator n=1 Tax=Lactobacillus delbrueckii TaxID=1584 RepID=UPI002167DE87|nr:LacI family DNA-binding transcriptional regulator [Lactobacillus delbrueckii]